MYRVRESKSKLKLFYGWFMDLFCHFLLALDLNICLKAVWNFRYVYRSNLMPFKSWKCFRRVIFARATNVSGKQS